VIEPPQRTGRLAFVASEAVTINWVEKDEPRRSIDDRPIMIVKVGARPIEVGRFDIRRVVVARDGCVLVGTDAGIQIFGEAPGKAVRGLACGDVKEIQETRDGCALVVLASGSIDHWDLGKGERLPLGDVPGLPSATAVVPGSARVLLLVDGHLVLADLDAGKRLGSAGDDLVPPIAISPDGTLGFAADERATIHGFELATGKALPLLEGHFARVTALAVSPDGKSVLSAANDGTLRYWDVGTGREIPEPPGHTGAVTALAVSKDGKLLLTGSDDRTAALWSTFDGQRLHVLKVRDAVVAVAFSDDGKAGTYSSDGKLRVWSAETGELLETTAPSQLETMTFGSSGRFTRFRTRELAIAPLASGRALRASEGALELLDRSESSGRILTKWKSPYVPVLAVTQDGRRALVGHGPLELWDLDKGARLRDFEDGRVDDLDVSSDGKIGLSLTEHSRVRVWVLDGGWASDLLEVNDGRSVTFLPGDRSFLVGTGDGHIQLFRR
jgi:WD40 repeat protein